MAYHRCKWCQGAGCVYCETMRIKDEQAEEDVALPESTRRVVSGREDGLKTVVDLMVAENRNQAMHHGALTFKSEIIGGFDILDVIQNVDLSIAYSPVVEHPWDGTLQRPVEIIHDPGPGAFVEWELKRHDGTGRPLGPDMACPSPVNNEHKIARRAAVAEVQWMRARFLLLRDYYAKQLQEGTLEGEARKQVIDWYFGGTFLMAKPGSAIADAILSAKAGEPIATYTIKEGETQDDMVRRALGDMSKQFEQVTG